MTQINKGGVSTMGLLGVALIVLKLTNQIDWSWWWVTVPFWGSILFIVGLLILFMIIGIIKAVFFEKPEPKISKNVKKSIYQEKLEKMMKEQNITK